MWDLWWTKWQWCSSVFPCHYHSTITMYHRRYTGWSRRKVQCFERWYYRPLWEKNLSNFWMANDRERVPFESPALTKIDFCLWVAWTAKFTKERWTRQTDCSPAFWMLLPAYKNVKINSNEQRAIFEHELKIALRLKVGFSRTCCKLQQICYLNVKLKSK